MCAICASKSGILGVSRSNVRWYRSQRFVVDVGGEGPHQKQEPPAALCGHQSGCIVLGCCRATASLLTSHWLRPIFHGWHGSHHALVHARVSFIPVGQDVGRGLIELQEDADHRARACWPVLSRGSQRGRPGERRARRFWRSTMWALESHPSDGALPALRVAADGRLR